MPSDTNPRKLEMARERSSFGVSDLVVPGAVDGPTRPNHLGVGRREENSGVYGA